MRLFLALFVAAVAILGAEAYKSHRNHVFLERHSRTKAKGTQCGDLECPFDNAVCCPSKGDAAASCCPSGYKCHFKSEKQANVCRRDKASGGSTRDPKVQKWIEQARKNKEPVVEVSLREGKGDAKKTTKAGSNSGSGKTIGERPSSSKDSSSSSPVNSAIQKMIEEGVKRALNSNKQQTTAKKPEQQQQQQQQQEQGKKDPKAAGVTKKDDAISKSESDREKKAAAGGNSDDDNNNGKSKKTSSSAASKNGWRPKQNIIIVKNINVLTHGIRPSSSAAAASSNGGDSNPKKKKTTTPALPSDSGP